MSGKTTRIARLPEQGSPHIAPLPHLQEDPCSAESKIVVGCIVETKALGWASPDEIICAIIG